MDNKRDKQTNEQYFNTDHIKSDLKGHFVKSGIVTTTTQIIKFALLMGSTAIIARILSPKDFGLVAMVTAVTGFVSLFKDLGLSAAVVQKSTITHEQVSSLFWVNVLVSIALMLLTASLAPFIALYYKDPRLTNITLVISIGYIFGGLTVQHNALLKRQMRFGALAKIEVASTLVGIVVGITSALMKRGYWSLLFMSLAMSMSTMIGAWIATKWRPAWLLRGAGIRSMLVFGRNLTGFNILNYIGRNIDNVLIGRLFGPEQLGYYTKAYALLLMPMQQFLAPVTNVAVPTLCRLANDLVRLRKAFLSIVEKLALISMLIVALLMSTSDLLIYIMLGPQWSEANRLFLILGVAAFNQPIASTTSWLLTSLGETRLLARWGLINVILTIGAILGGLHWGTLGVAAFYSFSSLLVRTPLLFWIVGRNPPVYTSDYYKTAGPYFLVAIIVIEIILLLRCTFSISNPFVGLVTWLFVGTFSYVSILLSFPFGRKILKEGLSILKELRCS